jgi:hypothetical protein
MVKLPPNEVKNYGPNNLRKIVVSLEVLMCWNGW